MHYYHFKFENIIIKNSYLFCKQIRICFFNNNNNICNLFLKFTEVIPNLQSFPSPILK